jgi:hypothetical protein
MLDYQWRLMMANDRIESLRRSATRRPLAPAGPSALEPERGEVELRLCSVSDDQALADLAMLSGRPVPPGRLVVAIVEGRLVAAVPLAGGQTLADPFERTEQLVRLLELRAVQLREVGGRRSLLPRALGLLRHA